MAKQAQSQQQTRARAGTAARTPRRRNDTPNTPNTQEGKLYRMKVDELRQMARKQNINGFSTMRKADLVKSLTGAMGGRKAPARGAKKAVRPATRTTAGRAGATKSVRGAVKSIRGAVKPAPSAAKSTRGGTKATAKSTRGRAKTTQTSATKARRSR